MRQVALVTGGGRGLGRSLVKHLAQSGRDVVVHYHTSEDGALAVVDECRQLGVEAHAVAGDLSTSQGAGMVLSCIEQKFGKLDVLIHNSGVYSGGAWDEISEAQWRQGIESTVTAGWMISRACMPLLRQADAGRLILVGDSSCEHPGARDLALSYHIGKTGILMLARSIAQAEAPHGITANVISPGYLENTVDPPPVDRIPAGRFGTFGDIAAAMDFLLSDGASYYSGGHLLASGGWNLR